jgi:hypothetical protein
MVPFGATYSFNDVQAAISGPGGAFPIGAGSGNSAEGITIEFDEDKDRMIFGADGSYMHSLNPAQGGRVIIRLLKTSPVNELLADLYNFQTPSSLFHGQNTIVLSNPVTGDLYTCVGVAFQKFPRNDWAKEGGVIEWIFNAGVIQPVLGAGIPIAA